MTRADFRAALSRNRRVVLGAGLPLTLLLLVNVGLSIKAARINELLDEYECRNVTCETDFDGDGAKDLISLDQTTPPPPYYTSWLTVRVQEKDALRLPIRFIDGSLRTHIATVPESGGAKLLIADRKVGRERLNTDAVFVWSGSGFLPQPPSGRDREILSAMVSFDDAGYGAYWLVFGILKWPIYLTCLLLLLLILKHLMRPTQLL